MATWRLEPSTLHPPAVSADDAAAVEESLPWALLELKAYVAKCDNATIAFSSTWDGKRIQVTFCGSALAARRAFPTCASTALTPLRSTSSPRSSPWRTTSPSSESPSALRRTFTTISTTTSTRPTRPTATATGRGRRRSLTFRGRRSNFFDANDIGVVRYRTDDGDEHAGNRGYVVVGLHRAVWGQPAGQFDLCVYDSRRGD